MISATSPWLVKLFYSFQDEQYLYMIMEFCPGGTLESLVEDYRVRAARPTIVFFGPMMSFIFVPGRELSRGLGPHLHRRNGPGRAGLA